MGVLVVVSVSDEERDSVHDCDCDSVVDVVGASEIDEDLESDDVEEIDGVSSSVAEGVGTIDSELVRVSVLELDSDADMERLSVSG